MLYFTVVGEQKSATLNTLISLEKLYFMEEDVKADWKLFLRFICKLLSVRAFSVEEGTSSPAQVITKISYLLFLSSLVNAPTFFQLSPNFLLLKMASWATWVSHSTVMSLLSLSHINKRYIHIFKHLFGFFAHQSTLFDYLPTGRTPRGMG